MKTFLVLILTLASDLLHGQSKTTLVITTNNVIITDSLILLRKTSEDYVPFDTFVLRAGQSDLKQYNFKRHEFVALKIIGSNLYQQLIVDGAVSLRYDADKNVALVTGSAETRELEKIDLRFSKPVRQEMVKINSLIREYAERKDSVRIDSLRNLQSLAVGNLADSFKLYVSANPNSLVSLDLVQWLYGRQSPTEIRRMIYSLDKRVQTHPVARSTLRKVEIDLQFDEGRAIPNFDVTDAAGRKFSSSEFKNKLILLDFWGTWCGPCIASIPDVIKIKNRFKDKGLIVISYAKEFNIAHEDFERSEKRYNISWASYYEVSKKPTGLLSLFNITEYPSYLLIKNGIIVKKVTSGRGLLALADILEKM